MTMKTKTWKRILSLVLVFIMVLGMITANDANVFATEAGDFGTESGELAEDEAVKSASVQFDQAYAKAGEALTVTVEGMEDITYTWYVDGKIVDSTSNSYTPTEDDLESFIEVVVASEEETASAKMYFSKLPVVYIDTENNQAITSKEDYINANLKIQGNEEYNNSSKLYDGATEIRGRGNSTWGMPKKPYKLKLDKKTDLFGMGKNKHWVLLANYSDESLMRNTLSYNFSGSLGMEQMSTVWVTVILNGSYEGNYQLCEQVRVDETRIDVFDWEGFAEDSAEIIAAAEGVDQGDLEEYMLENMSWITSGEVNFGDTPYLISDYPDIEVPSINGGYVLELDEYYDEVSKFRTNSNQPIMFKNPEFVATNTDMFNFVKDYVQGFEDAVQSDDYTSVYNGEETHYSELYDFDALVDYWLISEIFFNEEINKKSTYMYKDIDELVKMGPIWDMDYSSGGEGQTYITNQWATLYYNINAQANQWYKDLVQDPYFVIRAQERYWEIRDVQVADMLTSLEDSYELLKESAEANGERWNYGKSYESYVAILRDWFTDHLAWMDEQMATEDSLADSLWYKKTEEIELTLANSEGIGLSADDSDTAAPADWKAADDTDLTLTVTGASGISGEAEIFVNSRKAGSVTVGAASETITLSADVLTAGIGEKDVIEVKLCDEQGYVKAVNFTTVKAVEEEIEDDVESDHAARPENGTTNEQPFISGTGGSNNFRIPCLVTLDDGTLVAACDARWTTSADGGGLDTIVSYSKDNGETWNYTFANHIGDNGNVHNSMSTAFIDPALVTDGETVYMIADLYPAGIALNGATYGPQTGSTGYDEDGNLILAAATDSVNASSSSTDRMGASYEYHLEKIEGAADTAKRYYVLKDANGETVSGYRIDAYFNIVGNGVNTNLFCGDSPYFPYPTNFLYMTKSTDGGATWSVPTMIDIKKESEQTLLVGPGRGTVTSTGRIVFTAYEYTSGDKNSCAFYSDDGGVTWERGESVSSWSSEAAVTEADGRLYMFTRHGGYYVSENYGESWSDKLETGITYNTGCEITAITYSQPIDGKTAILLAAPSNTGSRAQGKIFVGLVEEDGSLDWAYQYEVTDGYYAYSCLTELQDNSIGLLWENGGANIKYSNISMREIKGTLKKVELEAGESYVDTRAVDGNQEIVTAPDESIATLTSEVVSTIALYNHKSEGTANSVEESFEETADASLNLDDCLFTFTQTGDAWNVYNEAKETYIDLSSANNYYGSAEALTFEAVEGGFFRIKRSDGNYALLYTPSMVFDRWSSLQEDDNKKFSFTLLEKQESVSSDDVIPGYTKVTEIQNDGQYLITHIWDDGSVLVLYPTNGQAAQTKLVGSGSNVSQSIVTITGVAKGTTTAKVGDVEYQITVKNASIPTSEMTATAGDAQSGEGADRVLDGDSSTLWHTTYSGGLGFDGHWVQLALNSTYMIDGLRYQPRQSGNNGVITSYRIETSMDGSTWQLAKEGEWGGDSAWKEVEFEAVEAKYVRLTSLDALSAESANDYSSAAEIRLTGTKSASEPDTPEEPDGQEIQEFDDQETLIKNATANSEQLPAGYTNDGGAAWAFDDESHWWHSRYQNWDQKGDHEVGSTTTTAAGPGKPTADNPIWIQTGFDKVYYVDHITYQGRSNGMGVIENYELAVANLSDPTATPTDSDFVVVKSDSLDSTTAAQTIQLNEAVPATHIRLIAYSVHTSGGGDGHVAAQRIRIFGYEAEETPDVPDVPDTEYTVTLPDGFTGSTVITDGGDYTFSASDSSYDYVFTATMGGEPVEVIANGDGTYTIHNVTGDLVITAEQVETVEAVIEVCEYVKVQNVKSLFLITVSGQAGAGKVFAYDGNPMFYSEEYGAYAYLVIAETALNEVKAEAEEKVTAEEMEAVAITYDGDINQTGRVDINDVQLTYNMYNAHYNDFSFVSMERFLRADMNHDKSLSVLDSVAIAGTLRR